MTVYDVAEGMRETKCKTSSCCVSCCRTGNCLFCLDAWTRLEDLRSGSLLSGEAQGACQPALKRVLGLEDSKAAAETYSGWEHCSSWSGGSNQEPPQNPEAFNPVRANMRKPRRSSCQVFVAGSTGELGRRAGGPGSCLDDGVPPLPSLVSSGRASLDQRQEPLWQNGETTSNGKCAPVPRQCSTCSRPECAWLSGNGSVTLT